jgi:hypothetical protein
MKSRVVSAREKRSESSRERRRTLKERAGLPNTTEDEINVDIAHYWGVFLKKTCLAVFKFKAEALTYAGERASFPLNVIEIERKS